MPQAVQYLTMLDPMRWFLECLRGVVIKGVGARELWHAILGQSILAVSYLTMAVSRFRKTMA
jgi:ABC-2 type transport system permease protein